MSTFSDARIIELLQEEFLPVAGNCADLQYGRTAASRWFLAMAAQAGRPLKPGGTTQGLYICAPNGTNYAYLNSRNSERVFAMLTDSLHRFQREPPPAAEIKEVEPLSPTLASAPEGVEIVRVYSRIGPLTSEAVAPLDESARALNAGIGRDHLWFLRSEREDLLGGSGVVGNRVSLPPTFVARIVRFHLVDNVRGEPNMWRRSAVKRAEFDAILIRATTATRTYAFRGAFRLATNGGGRGYEGEIEGEFEIAVADSALKRFRAHARGEAWGSGTYTPGAPAGRFPLVIAMIESERDPGPVVPPQASVNLFEYSRPRLFPKHTL